jgi:hypothetical protein
MEPTPSTIVQKITGEIIILTRFTKPVPTGLSAIPKLGHRMPTAMPARTAMMTAMYSQ